MQRREGRSSIKLPEDRIVNEAMLPELRSAMHDSTSRCRHFGVGKNTSDPVGSPRRTRSPFSERQYRDQRRLRRLVFSRGERG
jgi:hypothetical protein